MAGSADLPEWFPLIRAARYLGVPPWELMDRPKVWMEWALMAEGYERASGGGCPLMGL